MSLSKGGWLEDVSLVKKYEISDEDYVKRDKNFRKFKEEKLAEDPNWSIKKQMALQRGEVYVPPEVRQTHNSTRSRRAGSSHMYL